MVQFKTNLGGLAFTGNTSSTVGKSTIKASCDKPDTSEGTFKIVATSDPVTTTVHYLTVQPKESAEGFNFVKKIKVTVKPAMGNYRINFRAINDRTHYKGGNGTDNYESTLEEKKETNNVTGENTNWADGWYDLRIRIYLTQTIIIPMSIPRLVRQPELKSTLKFGNLQKTGLVIKWLRIIRMWVGITWTSKRMRSRMRS